MLWILLTAAAAPLQVARNALQRGLVGDAGPWGATLVRFLFGLPFSLIFFVMVALLTPGARPHFAAHFWLWVCVGALAQVGATASLLVAMRRAGFAVATAMQQSSLPLAAIVGLFLFGDKLTLAGWAGVASTTVGIAILSWPRDVRAEGAFAGGLLGLMSGGAFAFALNGYRQSGLTLEPNHPIYAAAGGICVAQTMQSAVLALILALTRPAALRSVVASWRQSLGAGFFGSAASACWFASLAQAPAAMVRAVGVVEIPVAAAAGARLFKEKMSLRQAAGAALAALGVVATALS